jgi:hypothetical protein
MVGIDSTKPSIGKGRHGGIVQKKNRIPGTLSLFFDYALVLHSMKESWSITGKKWLAELVYLRRLKIL